MSRFRDYRFISLHCLEGKGWVANDKSFNNYAYLVFKQYSLPLTFRASSECAFKQHVQSIHSGATTILKWQVCNICQTLSERCKKVGDGICDLLLSLMLSLNKFNAPYYLVAFQVCEVFKMWNDFLRLL